MPQNRHAHLRRLDRVWAGSTIYFITTCVAGRDPILASISPAGIVRDQFEHSPARYGWLVGRYVIMPDHIHFFCAPGGEREPTSLSVFVAGVKMWSARSILAKTERAAPLWQREFFDRLLRSNESCEEKWAYLRDNPVRAGLAGRYEDWPFAGEIQALSF